VTLDDGLVQAIKQDHRTAPVSEAEHVMLEYIDRMTRDAVQLGREDIARLREVGYDDTAILQMTLIGAWFNYVNRVADALGVGRG
jgi:alkylhydroperoxidase family enzyme